jgi:flagellar basal-body rod modification protein FlgD
MDIALSLSPQELAAVNREVDTFNKSLGAGKSTPGGELGKDDFLKILITQLSHQDPTQPMQDKDFIAQMAQFSSLEQITNMNQGMAKMASLLARGQALGMLGSLVDIADAGQTVSGLVEEVTGGEFPQILVNGRYYDFSQVQKIKREVQDTRGAAAPKE